MKKVVVMDGAVRVVESDPPVISMERPNRVLIKVHYSAISPGTEMGLLANPNVPNGFALGYSAAGEVMETGSGVTGLKKGDWVACYGAPYVHHAELLAVPEMLCAKLSSKAMLKAAAFAGLGAVAVHSVRRMRLQFGESVWVIGLGLLGQLILQICASANYRVLATDMSADRCEVAKRSGIGHVYLADHEELGSVMREFTEGCGFDAIAVCAHSQNKQMVNMALEQLAFRGKIAIVGNVPVEFSRELFFQKEADFVIARAAGPGRYDPQYEDQGVDYPRAYVRWTESRNLREFVRQIEAGDVNIAPLISAEIPLEEVEKGYGKLAEQGATLGVLLRYE